MERGGVDQPLRLVGLGRLGGHLVDLYGAASRSSSPPVCNSARRRFCRAWRASSSGRARPPTRASKVAATARRRRSPRRATGRAAAPRRIDAPRVI